MDPANTGRESALATKTTVTFTDGRKIQGDIHVPASGTKHDTGFMGKPLLGSDARMRHRCGLNTNRLNRGSTLLAISQRMHGLLLHVVLRPVPVAVAIYCLMQGGMRVLLGWTGCSRKTCERHRWCQSGRAGVWVPPWDISCLVWCGWSSSVVTGCGRWVVMERETVSQRGVGQRV